mgnify:CR=1 FL=1
MALKYTELKEYIITCDRCGYEESNINSDWRPGDTPEEYFMRRGWVDLDGHTFCFECIQQLKNQQKIVCINCFKSADVNKAKEKNWITINTKYGTDAICEECSKDIWKLLSGKVTYRQ